MIKQHLLEWIARPPIGSTVDITATLIDAGSHLDRALDLAGFWNLESFQLSSYASLSARPQRARQRQLPRPLRESPGARLNEGCRRSFRRPGLHQPVVVSHAATGQLDQVRGSGGR